MTEIQRAVCGHESVLVKRGAKVSGADQSLTADFYYSLKRRGSNSSLGVKHFPLAMIAVKLLQILFSRRRRTKMEHNVTLFFTFCGRSDSKFAKRCGFPPRGCKFDKLVPLLQRCLW